MISHLDRRQFITAAAGPVVVYLATRNSLGQSDQGRSQAASRLFFTSQGHTGLIDADGSGLRYLKFDVPNQTTWQPCGFFSDGRRVLFLSMEPRRDGPGKPFDEYYHQTPTHLWIHDLESGSLTEIATRERRAFLYTAVASR